VTQMATCIPKRYVFSTPIYCILLSLNKESIAPLRPLHEKFLVEAAKLKRKYAGQIKILIGFEGEWIRPSYAVLINELASNPVIDFYIGSVHHVHEIPIDYDAVFYRKAREVAGGSDERLFGDYFDAQFEMLNALRPRVVGHLDLIRLLSDEPNRDLREMKGVWEKVVRNLKVITEQGGLIEVNTSALRKGLKEPYPMRSICEHFLGIGGMLTLSDDSHGVAHVGTNYEKGIAYLESLGVKDLYTLDGKNGDLTSQVNVRSVALVSIKKSFKA
jgi:histidinol-phosphatase (PHP family)